MANANWQGGRQKTKQAVYAMFRHNDRDRRQDEPLEPAHKQEHDAAELEPLRADV